MSVNNILEKKVYLIFSRNSLSKNIFLNNMI